MHILPNDLKQASQRGLITAEQAQQLWDFLQTKGENTPQFRFSHLLYYLGGMLAIAAVTLLLTQAWDSLRGVPLFTLSTALFCLGIALTHYFLAKKLAIPAGIMSTFSLALIPLAIYNLQIYAGWLPDHAYHYTDFHEWISWYWVPMELLTLGAGIIMLYVYRFSFLLFLISVMLWYLSMDLYSLLLHLEYDAWRSSFSMAFGLCVLAGAVYVDFKANTEEPDYAYWLYIFGVLIFWGGTAANNGYIFYPYRVAGNILHIKVKLNGFALWYLAKIVVCFFKVYIFGNIRLGLCVCGSILCMQEREGKKCRQ